jgi:ABC-type lipoprotein release transport system permease subunit
MFKVLFYYALRNIFRVRLRSFFTIFVISLVFSLFILLTSIGEELSRQLTNTLDEKKIDIVIQSKFSDTPFSSSIPYEKVNEIITLDDVQYATTLLIGKKRLNKKASLFLLGFSDFTPIAKRIGIGLIKGREFNENYREVAIGQKVARILKLDVGDSIRLDDKAPYLITGIYSIGLDFLDACAYIGMSDAQRLLNRPNRTA